MTETYGKTKVACYIGYVVQAIINNFVPLLFVFGNVFPSTSHPCPLRVAGQQHTKETCC